MRHDWCTSYCFVQLLKCSCFLWFAGDFVLSLPVFYKYLEPNRCICIENEFWYVNEFDICDCFIRPSKSQTQGLGSVAYESCQ